MPAPIPVHQQFTDEQKVNARTLFLDGYTHLELGIYFDRPERTMAKLCKHLGLKRTVKEAAELKNKSKLDTVETVEYIRRVWDSASLQEIADTLGSSTSSVKRICDKHGIKFDKDKKKAITNEKLKTSWSLDKRESMSCRSKNVSQDTIKKISDSSKRLWQKEAYRNKQLVVQKALWNTEDGKAFLAKARSIQSKKVSSIQNTLYSLLNDLGVKHYRENDGGAADSQCVIGPYNFDCVIPRDNNKSLIIECQGDYWHSLEKAIRMDKAKATYFDNYLSDKYELKYIWEHEFDCQDKVVELLKYWLNLTKLEVIDFDFSDIVLKPVLTAEYKLLLQKYHYLQKSDKGGKAFGAFFDNEIVAVCVFSSPIRQNVSADGCSFEEIKELSRLCIHPRYQKRNFGSWFISKCIKQLPENIKAIVSYCDTTYNHTGAVYKAAGFKFIHKVRPDYAYRHMESGWAMHKKSLYNKAVKMSLKESEYAEKFGYQKIYGSDKLKFVFYRN